MVLKYRSTAVDRRREIRWVLWCYCRRVSLCPLRGIGVYRWQRCADALAAAASFPSARSNQAQPARSGWPSPGQQRWQWKLK